MTKARSLRSVGIGFSVCPHRILTSAYKLIVQELLNSIIDVFECVNSVRLMDSASIFRPNIY